MSDEDKTREQLIEELAKLRRRNAKLEAGNRSSAKLSQQTEEAFTESGKTLHLLFDSSHDLITIADANAVTIWANPAWTKLFGPIEKCVHDPLELIHPDDHDKVILAWEDLVTEEREIRDMEYRYRMPDGSYRTFESSAFKMTVGEEERYCVIARDITERKQAAEALRETEEDIRSVINSMDDLVFVLDTNGIFKSYYQPETKADLYVPPEEFIGKHFGDVLPPHMCESAQDAIEKIHVHRETQQFDYHLVIEGQERWYNARISPVIGQLGDITGFAVVSRDITKRKRMEEELLKVEKLESIGVLAGGIAHDLNNLLTGVVGNISLARIYEDPAKKDTSLVEAEKASMRIKDLTHQLLIFARGGVPILQTADIGELLRHSVTFTLRGSNVRCEFSIPDDLWPVAADEGQVNQVINNLVINARQAMPNGGIIRIRAENVTIDAESGLPLEAGSYTKVSIQDEGTGISQEHIQKIFDPFFTTKHEGNGLGLATSYSIIQKHNGHITVESELGAGATFHIYLPASPEGILVERAEETAGPIMGVGRILVMDDEELVRNLASNMLTDMGYKVTTVIDGVQAIEIYKEAMGSGDPYDAVIIDLTIPGGMGGKEAIQRLAEIDPEIKTIVSSGYSNDPIMANFREYGFSGFIAKPYKTRELSMIMHGVITGGDLK